MPRPHHLDILNMSPRPPLFISSRPLESQVSPPHSRIGSEEQLGYVIQEDEDTNDDARQLQDGDLVPGGGHAAHARGGSLEGGGHGGERVGGIVDDILGAGVVVDVNGHAAQGGDLGGELVEACVVLALAFVGFGHGGRWRGGGQAREVMLLTMFHAGRGRDATSSGGDG